MRRPYICMPWLALKTKASFLPQTKNSKSHRIRSSKMASPKVSSHTRSTSLPSASHPLDSSIEDLLRRLSASQAEPSSSSLCQNLFNLKDLYEQMNDLIRLPHNQNTLSHEPRMEEVEKVVDGSLTLMDVSSSAMDALSLMKESILNLQSALRRGTDNEEINTYLMSRKKICKTVSKCLANLKNVEKKSCTLTQQENDGTTTKMLNKAEAISVSILKSLLQYVMGKKIMSQARGWSLVAKLVKSKHVSTEICSEVEAVDCALHSATETKVLLRQLDTLEMTIHELMDVLESVCRCLVKARVSLLNVLNC